MVPEQHVQVLIIPLLWKLIPVSTWVFTQWLRSGIKNDMNNLWIMQVIYMHLQTVKEIEWRKELNRKSDVNNSNVIDNPQKVTYTNEKTTVSYHKFGVWNTSDPAFQERHLSEDWLLCCVGSIQHGSQKAQVARAACSRISSTPCSCCTIHWTKIALSFAEYLDNWHLCNYM